MRYPYPAAAYAGGFYTVRHDALAFVGADGALWLVPVPSGGKARRLITGEGHGWMRAHTIKAYVERMERFLQDYVLLR